MVVTETEFLEGRGWGRGLNGRGERWRGGLLDDQLTILYLGTHWQPLSTRGEGDEEREREREGGGREMRRERGRGEGEREREGGGRDGLCVVLYSTVSRSGTFSSDYIHVYTTIIFYLPTHTSHTQYTSHETTSHITPHIPHLMQH